ncbi:TonB-dependent receptor [Parachitinimonas caeni]|uniref:TonB-dependent receptor n=1 Tax=Parachitinimonas caeni TaxID=3031301 RepID=A0ABT7E3Y5_9NEIS|nr:TonB-dependent receptor [Parachitinimonas caeni]MDK2126959.1 TonB-dependent receptor [Parachitinimonas caeni]
MSFKTKNLCLALAVAFPGTTFADVNRVDAVEVTARAVVEEIRLDAFASTAAVVGEAQLRDQNALDLTSALRRTPGVQISRYNPVGAFGGDQGGAVFVRGMGLSRPGSEIKTSIDGIPFYMGLWNHPLLDLLPVSAMRSVRVEKGPQPQHSGNRFASINLETRRAGAEGVQGDMRLSAGSHRTLSEQASLSGRQGPVDFVLVQGHAESAGHRPNADGRLDNLLAKAGWQLDPHWAISGTLLAVDNRAGDPGDARLPAPAQAPQYRTRAHLLSAALSHQHGDWQGQLSVFHNEGDGDWLYQPAPDGDGYNHFSLSGLRWQEHMAPWTDGRLWLGLDIERLGGDARFQRVAPAPSSRFDAPGFHLVSPYLAISQRLALNADWSLQPSLGLRVYRHSEFASETAPHLGLQLQSGTLTWFANYARGVSYPGLETPLLASLIPPLGNSWKRLNAETLHHTEIGLQWAAQAATRLDISLFSDQLNNRYVFGFPPDVPPPPQFINLGDYRMRGAELALQHDLDRHWRLFGGLTLLDPSIDNLPYTPRRALTLGLNGQIGPVRLALDAQYQSETRALNRARVAGASNLQTVGSFAVVNARLGWLLPRLGKKGEVFLALDNLLDRDYTYRPGYPMPGRSAQLGLAASF